MQTLAIMSETTRTFFAIEIPERLGFELVRLQEKLAHDLPECRWARSTPFHLTLAFLGDVRDHDLAGLHELVAASVGRFEPIELCFEGIGTFPSPRRPRVLWAGLDIQAPEVLLDIRKSVVAAAAFTGYACEDERFHPHVTLGRFKPGRRGPLNLTAILERHRSWTCGGFAALDVVGYASRMGRAGTTYEALSRGRLCGEKSRSLP
jgi:RNA 2',3'-cyclic 3'-phosphodiesterase